VYIHIGRDDRLLRISATHVSRWLGEQKLPRMAFLKALEAEFSFREVVGILGGGTLYSAGAKERLYEVNMDNPKLVSFLE
jgi:GcrA cell cycle regulator